MKQFGFNLYEAMREARDAVRAQVEPGRAAADEAYHKALRHAKAQVYLTNDATCVVCTRCGALRGDRCTTRTGRPTTTHSVRNYEYQDAVAAVHFNPIVQAAKARLDEYIRLAEETDYAPGRATEHVRVQENRSVMAVYVIRGETWAGYKPAWTKNVLGLRPSTLFSHAEINFMLCHGVDIHMVDSGLRDALIRWLEPPDVREERRRVRQTREQTATRAPADAADFEKFRQQIAQLRQKVSTHVRPTPVGEAWREPTDADLEKEELLNAVMRALYGSEYP